MKTGQGQGLWRLGRGAFGLQVAMLVLMMLAAGISPVWAGETWDKTGTDDGGGTYRYRGEGDDIETDYWKPGDNGYFKTTQFFDAGKDQFYWNFQVRVNYFYNKFGGQVNSYSQEYYGNIYVVTADDVAHKIATWSKKGDVWDYTPYNKVDMTWGEVHVSNVRNAGTEGYVEIDYTPTDRAIQDGVKRIIMRQDITGYAMAWVTAHGSHTVSGWVEYQKDLDFSSIVADKPMTKLSVGWDENGKLAAKATGVPDKRNNDKWKNQFYKVKTFYYDGSSGRKYESTFATKDETATCTDGNNSKMDMSFDFLPSALANKVYTVPLYVKYRGGMEVNPKSPIVDRFIELNQPEADIVEIAPYTRPTKVWVEYDQWKKKNVVRWERQQKERGHNGSKETTVECSTDGKWYVIRYAKGGSATDYGQSVKELGGTAKTLEVTDTDIDYDKSYVYRVIFLPKLLESKYKDKLASLPGSQSAGDYNLWREAEVNTALNAQVRLSHDMTCKDSVKLVWEYNIQAEGLKWYIDSRASANDSWKNKEELEINTKNTTAEYKFLGTVCDRYDYRVRTSLNGSEICSNIVSANLPAGTEISEVTASTGTEESTVLVKWKVKRPDADHDIWYRVQRRIVGEGEDGWTTLTDAIHGTASEYEYTDTRPLAGTYYEYRVEAFGALCDEQLKPTSDKIAAGFSQARGTITGHISFGSGTAVQGVRVDLVKTSSDDETSASQFLSRYISGKGQGLHWTADSEKYLNTLNGQKPVSLQLWAKPQSTDKADEYQELLHLAGALELGVKSGTDGSYHLYAIDRSNGGTARKEFTRLVFDDLDFTHIAAVYDKMKWKFYVGNDSLLVDSMTVASSAWNAVSASHGDHASTPTMSLGGDNRVSGSSAYVGYVDDIRLWLRALTPQEIESNYTRILGGTEKGLTLYWPLDEGEAVKQYAFDIARQDGIYQLNHPTVGANVDPKTEKPSRLKLYGVTDSEGDYIIRGIPFQQGGTNYKIVPKMGVHEFSPGTRTMFVSPTSLTANNIDFEDVSSFPMQGYVYYLNTNIPVEGAMLYVDGQPQSAYGESVKTDAEGHYEMNVPIGEHYVEVKLDDHIMVDGGRFPKTEKTHKFTESVRYDFVDSTLVNFVGRVGGGERNDTLAVGFAQSKNNIGVATIALKLNSDKLSFNSKTGTTVTYPDFRYWESDTTSINSHSFTGTATHNKYSDKLIYIQTDPVTGEFSAKVPPLKYTVQSITIEKNDNIQFTELPEIDMTIAKEMRKDSLRVPVNGGADSTWVSYGYHTKMVRTYYAKPQLSVVDTGADPGFYGLKKITFPGQMEGDPDIVIDDLYKEGRTPRYLVDYPIYKMGQTVKYHLFGYEAYENHDGAKVVCDTIALNHQKITITNEMSSEQAVIYKVMDESTGYKEGQIYDVQSQQIPLDDNGEAELTWTAGAPNIVAPYTRKFNILMEHKDRTYNVANLDAIVLGQLTNGDNFVTKGPDIVNFVLRDPQGAKSTTKLTTGTTITKTHYDTRKAYGNYNFLTSIGFGLVDKNGIGTGFILISNTSAKQYLELGANASWEKTWNQDTQHVETTMEGVATSGNKPYVGAPGDVYVGTSTNFLIGGCRHLFIDYNEEKEKYEVKLEDAISVGDSISTAFKFTQYELENVMIPKWKDTRRSFLTEVATEAEAKNYVNSGTSPVYLTWTGLNLDDYIEGVNYKWVIPESWKTTPPSEGPLTAWLGATTKS